MSPFRALFEPARLLILKETIVPAGLLKPAPFWILLLVLSKKKVKSAEIATKMLQQPRINFKKRKIHFNLIFTAYF